MGAVKKSVKFGAFSATLTQLAKGTHSGSWKITYRDASGTMRTGGVFKDGGKAKGRAMEISNLIPACRECNGKRGTKFPASPHKKCFQKRKLFSC